MLAPQRGVGEFFFPKSFEPRSMHFGKAEKRLRYHRQEQALFAIWLLEQTQITTQSAAMFAGMDDEAMIYYSKRLVSSPTVRK